MGTQLEFTAGIDGAEISNWSRPVDIDLTTPGDAHPRNEQSAPSKGDTDDQLPNGTPETGPETHDSTGNVSSGKEPPVTFVDPIGTRWALPYESCRTWAGMKSVVKAIFMDSYLPEYAIEEFEEKERANKGNMNFAVLKLNPERVVLQDHWESLIEPGWEFTVRFLGAADFVTRIANRKQRELEVKAQEEEESEEKSSTDQKPDGDDHGLDTMDDSKLPDRSYLVEYWQEDYTSRPDHLYDRAFEGKLELDTRKRNSGGKGIPGVIQEIRKVVFSRRRKDEISSKKSNSIHECDILGNPSIQIHSTKLLNALKDTIKFLNPKEDDSNLSKFSFDEDTTTDLGTGVFVFPYKDLYHHKDALVKYKNSKEGSRRNHSPKYNEDCDRHIDVLIEYLYQQPSIGLREAEQLWSLQVPRTTFNSYWLLLKPGTTVFARDGYDLNAYVIESVDGGPFGGERYSRHRQYTVTLWNLDFDGVELSRSERIIAIPLFDGQRDITSLPLFPTRFHEDEEGKKNELIERGKTFVNVVKAPAFREYSGPSRFYGARAFENARVVIDHTSTPWERNISENKTLSAIVHVPCERLSTELGSNARIPACQCEDCVAKFLHTREPRRIEFDDYDEIKLDAETTLTDHQYLLCWSHVYGFLLKDREWDLLSVAGLKPPNIQENVIDNLVMDKGNKYIIKAVCETYSQISEKKDLFFADFIRGKGEGQIMLLHGPPGTGKTLTAESVAEYTRRPLLSVTAADLGHEPEALERHLLRFFRDATRWDAIVLLDEADVYLQRRSANDLQRNSIVSVFLRALDYFQGILFLTTNRVGSFDEAFMSRIHIQIGYKSLDNSARSQIWDSNFAKLASNQRHGGRKFEIDYQVKRYVKESEDLLKLEWNGREIRNAFQTAVALASFSAKQDGDEVPMLRTDHLEQVVEMAKNFKIYMKQALQATNEEFAAMNRLRAPESQSDLPSPIPFQAPR